jgi:class 3 adenylate cyclase
MALVDDLKNKIAAYFKEKYEIKPTTIVPSTDYSKLTFGNTALTAELTFLFIDIRKSSELHDTYGYEHAARIYQSFHDICLRIINSRDGNVRAFDGDRIMGVFSGESKNDNAVEAAMNIRWAISNILNSQFKPAYAISIGIGIETGLTLITKVGKGRDISNNDIVWVGKACNYASHMCSHATNCIHISSAIYNKIKEGNKTSEGKNMWNLINLILKNGKTISCYKTTYSWSILKT